MTGGLGFLGRVLTSRVGARADEVVVYDAAQGDDICDTDRLRDALRQGDTVFHLAGIRGAQGEQDFDLALGVNLAGTRSVLEACRATRGCRLVFASTIAVFDARGRWEPRTTYGTTKAIGELLVNDYARRGFVDGRGGRLATIVIHPDAPVHSASGFASALFRESLAGRDYTLPVALERRVPVIGVSTAAACMIRLAEIAAEALGDDRTLTLPNLSVTVAELADAARRAGATGAITAARDPAVEAVMDAWPQEAPADRAISLGFPRDASIDSIVREYVGSATLST